MNRVYTDPRFAGFEVHNDGSNTFHVYEISNGERHEIDTFRTYSDHPQGQIPEEVAARRAKDYFDRMSNAFSGKGRHNMSQELDARNDNPTSVPIQFKKDTAPDAPYGLSASKDLDSLIGDNIMSADDVIAAFEAAKQMPDGPEKQKAMAQVKAMAARMESSASELVRNLLD